MAVYPTDTSYGLGCDLYSKRSIDRIRLLKGLDETHPMSFLCSDLSQVASYAVVDDRAYRILRHHMPGQYTFILPATRQVPKIIQSKTRTVGVRIPDSAVCKALVEELGHPIVSTTVSRKTPEGDVVFNDPDEIVANLGRSVEVILDAGPLYEEPSSVIDLTTDPPTIVRRGSGDLSWLGG